MVSPMYEADQVEKLNWLTSNGYDFRNPNSVQSQMALQNWNSTRGSGGSLGVLGAVADSADTENVVSTTSSSGVYDPVVRDTLVDKATSTPTENTARNSAIDKVNELLASFSPTASTIDTNALLNQSIRKAQEAFMPGMTRGMQAAGQSGSSMQALMSQRAASDAAESAAIAANQAKSQYGNIAASLAGVLSDLTKADYGQEQLALNAAELLKTSEATPTVVNPTSNTTDSGQKRFGVVYERGKAVNSGTTSNSSTGSTRSTTTTPTNPRLIVKRFG